MSRHTGASSPPGTGAVRAEPKSGSGYWAVQDDVAVTVVDWPVMHAWREGDPDFVGAVTVIDGHGAQLVTAEWPSPTDRAADLALTEVGWTRTGPWERDWEGRRAAPVARDQSPAGPSLPHDSTPIAGHTVPVRAARVDPHARVDRHRQRGLGVRTGRSTPRCPGPARLSDPGAG